MFLLLVLGYISLFAQTSKNKFIPNARITLLSDTVIELSDFELHGPDYLPKFYHDVTFKHTIDIPLKIGNIWYMKSFEEIDKIIFTVNEKYSTWRGSEIFLKSGKSLKGETPTVPNIMWKHGNVIKIYGDVKILGTVGEFQLPIKEIREIRRDLNNPDEFILTTIKNEEKKITNPYLACYASGNKYRFLNYSLYNISMDFYTDGLLVELYPAKIDSIAFFNDKKVFVKMKDGNEAKGKFKDNNLYIKGITKSGTIWYQSVFGKKFYTNERGYPSSKFVANIKSINLL